jgi:hypothetical protein
MVETEEGTAVAPPQDKASVDVNVDETSPPENDAGGDGQASGAAVVDVGVGRGNGNRKGKKVDRREPKEQVPIEELYDLSKPIKRVSGGIPNAASASFFASIICLLSGRRSPFVSHPRPLAHHAGK